MTSFHNSMLDFDDILSAPVKSQQQTRWERKAAEGKVGLSRTNSSTAKTPSKYGDRFIPTRDTSIVKVSPEPERARASVCAPALANSRLLRSRQAACSLAHFELAVSSWTVSLCACVRHVPTVRTAEPYLHCFRALSCHTRAIVGVGLRCLLCIAGWSQLLRL